MNNRNKLLITVSIIELLILLFTVGGCIPVDNLGEYWDKGVVDKELEGAWKQINVEYEQVRHYIKISNLGDCLEVSSESGFMPFELGEMPGCKCKTLVSGKHKYLMLDLKEYYEKLEEQRKETIDLLIQEGVVDSNESVAKDRMAIESISKSGILRYSVEGENLTIYNINYEKICEAINKGNVKGKVFEEGILGPFFYIELEKQSLDFLSDIISDTAYWEEDVTFKRIEDIQKDIEESLKYKSTPETAQNSLVNINQPSLKYFAEGKSEILLRFLQSSPEWKVTKEGDDIICYQREKDRDNNFHFFPVISFILLNRIISRWTVKKKWSKSLNKWRGNLIR